jgi:hypothetical protein
MEVLLVLAVALYGLISVLLAFLAYTYGETALSTRARYPLGLFIFALLLLVHSAGTALGYLMMGNLIGDGAYPFMFGMAAFELVGVAALFRITM